ncbi:hypothetical protein ACQFYA_11580 [Promicromonospora sp. Marseille-Q5078]
MTTPPTGTLPTRTLGSGAHAFTVSAAGFVPFFPLGRGILTGTVDRVTDLAVDVRRRHPARRRAGRAPPAARPAGGVNPTPTTAGPLP